MDKKRTPMTAEQRKLIFKIGNEIKYLPEGSNIEIFASIDMVRIQHTKVETEYRMFSVLKDYKEKEIRNVMFRLFEEILKETKK